MKKSMFATAVIMCLALASCQKNSAEILTDETGMASPGDINNCIGRPLKGVSCFDVYQPVCGCDGVTYSNGCYAAVAGVKSYTPGSCDGSGNESKAAGK